MATPIVDTQELRIKLTKAVAQKRDAEVQRLLHDSVSSGIGHENDLHTILAKAISIGYETGVRLLLEAGARFDAGGSRGPLHSAIANTNDKTRNAIINLLLNHGCELEAKDADGRTPLVYACLRGHNDVMITLLERGADPNIEDHAGKNTLQIMASESKRNTAWSAKALSTLLSKIKNLNKRDSQGREGRTPLLWAAAKGQLALVGALLRIGVGVVDVNQSNDQGHSALHLAARHDEPEMIKLLVFSGAKIEARGDGDWTPLLWAAKEGNESAIDALLTSNANVNARTSSGMTSLHWAAESGKLSAVKRILRERNAHKNSKDSFDSTPLIRAAQNGHWDIVKELRPYVLEAPANRIAKKACERFRAAVVNFFEDKDSHSGIKNKVNKNTVWQILYARDDRDPEKFAIPTNLDTKGAKKPLFRWIHLPANNLSWLEALLTKWYLEGDCRDVTALKTLLQLLGRQQHRGAEVHSRFMRPTCKRLWVPPKRATETEHPASYRPAEPTVVLPAQQDEEVMVLLMPYLHWETDKNRASLTQTIREPAESTHALDDSELSSVVKDRLLIHGYMGDSTDLHPRRTLDQFKHHSSRTDHQDADQVVYRFCKKKGTKLKIFMVDQLWLITFGNLVISCFPERWRQPHRDPLNLFEGVVEDINSTTRPPVRNVFELATVITERCTGLFDRQYWDNGDRPDSNDMQHSDDLLFAEMFQLSIGRLTRKETKLFRCFREASSLWLRGYDSGNIPWESQQGMLENDYSSDWSSDEHQEAGDTTNDSLDTLHDHRQASDSFVNDLLNIDKEASLLVECKDVEDELEILTSVLRQQRQVLGDLDATLRASKNVSESNQFDLFNKVGEQQRLVDLDLQDLDRMARQARSVNDNLTQVLDLKQKHANAVEARAQRKQAEEAARQGQTIMVFTIVTIVFLPLSFLASFFAIDIIEFPRPAGTGSGLLHLNWVLQYIIGIGLALSVPLIGVAFVVGDIKTWWLKRESRKYRRRKGKHDRSRVSHPDTESDGVVEKNSPASWTNRFIRRRRRVAPSHYQDPGAVLPTLGYGAPGRLDDYKDRVVEQTWARRRTNLSGVQHKNMQPPTTVPAHVQTGRQPMSSMDSSRRGGPRYSRRLGRVGTEMTERSAATEDLEVGNGFGF
ncbi:hypothetical protein Z517_08086 [Fonsecaea pedrosoi CBS 271.37]|uniref:Ankyrin repeat protein n=1 Tax=Fonsecaea pedrosoi CBS 271.37 TaxID=1442368 RepID=A0A0D2EVI7_9EURO|nr:uncharacterized protein Z517_08086 [Fonsecaea pedrosoi CBS 271.37]KIW78252.1 hypothetical protein Z517_08086 [Fonsecaea pedrosoi CBS 271.37]